MPSEITPDVIRRLVSLGAGVDHETSTVLEHGQWLRDHKQLSYIHFKEWVDAAEALPVGAHVALLRALAFSAACADWNRGSPSPVIFVYHSVDRRLPFEESFALAKWVKSKVDGYYLPFGSLRLWIAFEDVASSSDGSWSGTVIELLWSVANRSRSERQARQAVIDAAIAEKAAERRVEEARERDRHLARKTAKDSARAELLAEAEGLDAVGRLVLVADRLDMPLPSFPDDWADVSRGDLQAIDEDLKKRLVHRLAGARLRTWKRLRDQLMLDPAESPKE